MHDPWAWMDDSVEIDCGGGGVGWVEGTEGGRIGTTIIA